MNEGDYLDMVNQLKVKYDEVEYKMDSILRMEKIIKKDIIVAYGVARLLDHLMDTSVVPYDNEIIVLIEMLRGILSDSIDKHILS
mgnify:FL=1|tara:strand:- start:177 stop:431 length:255 start_codon:yes stop_codon:yes gene_type:complete